METLNSGGLHFAATLNNSQLLQAAQQSKLALNGIGSTAAEQSNVMTRAFMQAGTAAAGFFSLQAAQGFLSKIVQVRGEMESLEISFRTLLGSKEKADSLMAQVKDYAVRTPMQLGDLAKGTQTLLSFGIQSEKVMDILKQIGDISMGDADKFKSLTLAFSQATSAGKLQGQDLLQMINAGFNPLNEMSKSTGKSIGELRKEMEKGQISAAMLADAFRSATSEGGQFHGMLDKQSQGLNGMLSNLEGAVDEMFNSIGEKLQTPITDAIGLGVELVQNYETIGKVILSAATGFGVYKAALASVVAIQKQAGKMKAVKEIDGLDAEINHLKTALPLKEQNKNADLSEAVAKKQLTASQAEAVAARREMLTAIQAEVQARKATLTDDLSTQQAQLLQAEKKLKLAQGENTAAQQNLVLAREQKALADARLSAAQAQAELERTSTGVITNTTADEVNIALREQAAAAELLDTAATEANTAAHTLQTAETTANTIATQVNNTERELGVVTQTLATTATEANTAATLGNTTAQGGAAVATESLTIAQRLQAVGSRAGAAATAVMTFSINAMKTAFNSAKVALMTNPFGVIVAALSIAVPLIMEFVGGTEDAADMSERFGKAADEATAKTQSLYAILSTKGAGSTKVHKEALQELTKTAEEYGLQIDKEGDVTEQLVAKKGELIRLIQQEAIERQRANSIEDASKAYEESAKEAREKLYSGLDGVLSKAQAASLLSIFDDQQVMDYTAALAKANSAWEYYVATVNTGNEELIKKAEAGYNKALQDLTPLQNSLNATLDSYSKGLGKTAEEQAELRASFGNLLIPIGNARREFELSTKAASDAANAAQTAADGMHSLSDSHYASNLSAQYARMSVEELSQTISKMIEQYNNSNINFKISYEEINQPPKWMQGFDAKKSKSMAGFWASQLADMQAKGIGKRYFAAHKKWMTAQEVGTLAGQYSKQAAGAEATEAKPKVTAPPKPKAAAKSKSSAGRSTKSGASEKDIRGELADAEKAMRELYDKLAETALSNELELADARNDAREEGLEKELAGLKNTYDRRKKDLADEEKTLFEEFKSLREAQWRKANAKAAANGEKFDADKVTKEDFQAYVQQATIDGAPNRFAEIYDQINAKREQAEADYTRKQGEALKNVLNNYKDNAAKLLDIEKDYNEKRRQLILAGASSQEMAMLNAAEQAAKEELNMSDLKAAINWDDVFGDLDRLSTERLGALKTQLTDALNSGTLSATDCKAVMEQISAVEGEIVKRQGGWLTALGLTLPTLEKIKQLRKDEALAASQTEAAQQRLNEAMANNRTQREAVAKAAERAGLSVSIDVNTSQAKDLISRVRAMAGDVEADKLTKAFAELAKTEGAATKAAKDLTAAQDKQAKAQRAAKVKWEDAMSMISEAADKIASQLSSAKELTDLAFGENSSASKALDGVNSSVNAAKDFASGNYLGAALNAVKAIGSFADAFAGGDSDSTLPRDMERLTASNEALAASIDSLGEKMDKQTATEAKATLSQQKTNLDKQIADTMAIMLRNGAASSGTEHSVDYNFNRRATSSMWQEISAIVGEQVNDARQIWALSSAQIAEIRESAPTLYAAIKEMADDGKGDVAQYLDKYADYAKQRAELDSKYLEHVTGITEKELQDQFKEFLTDANMSVEDLAKNTEKVLSDAVINSFMNGAIQESISKLHGMIAAAMSDDNKISDTELANIRAAYAKINADLEAQRSEMGKMGFIPDSDSSTRTAQSKGIATASQDSVDENNARLTAIQGHTYAIAADVRTMRESSANVLTALMSIDRSTAAMRDHLETMRGDMRSLRQDIADINTRGVKTR